jgi:hypothetical protein
MMGSSSTSVIRVMLLMHINAIGSSEVPAPLGARVSRHPAPELRLAGQDTFEQIYMSNIKNILLLAEESLDRLDGARRSGPSSNGSASVEIIFIKKTFGLHRSMGGRNFGNRLGDGLSYQFEQ